MPGSILPLPVMLEEEDRKIYDQLEAPKSIVVRFGYQRMIGELPYDGQAKPGCGSKLVVRTHRGIEMGEMLTTTCGNSGCGQSVSRAEMLAYIENSGGKNYPFFNQGKVVRVATVEDVAEQRRLDERKPQMLKFTRQIITELSLPMHLVEAELLLGGERIIFYYTAEQWVDFRELVRRLASEYQTRIEMHQVNAREEARLAADFERCGQHCCCRQFLKVLKPVSMKSAKIQKATLDPAKISGRCGRLMCCLRYEDQTYDELRKRLPHRQTRVLTADGLGTVLDTQILTQLVLVRLDTAESAAAYPLENIQLLSREEAARLTAEAEAARPPAPAYNGKRQEPPSAQGKEADHRRGRGKGGWEPRRPKPGAPLEQKEIQAREGEPIAEDEVENVTDGRDEPVPEGLTGEPDEVVTDEIDGQADERGDEAEGDVAGEVDPRPEGQPKAGGHQGGGQNQGTTNSRGYSGSNSRQGAQGGTGSPGLPGGSGGGAGGGPSGGGEGGRSRRRRRGGRRRRGRGRGPGGAPGGGGGPGSGGSGGGPGSGGGGGSGGSSGGGSGGGG
ncbi:MAG: hypothetical protein IT443_00175 [Phycisphaeraceae bacterium]|nr:hypothetical protein [Phycisphaeraceae bacterium]